MDQPNQNQIVQNESNQMEGNIPPLPLSVQIYVQFKKYIPFITVIGILLFLSIFVGLKVKEKISPSLLNPITTPTNIPPTQQTNHQINPIATSSAFIKLNDDTNSLIQLVNSANFQDTSINPPVLDLPLGFSN